MGMSERDIEIAQGLDKAGMADNKRKVSAAEAKGASDERMRIAMALVELDKVATPLEDRALELEREIAGTESPARILGVSRELRGGNGIAALTAVKSGRLQREEVTTINHADEAITRALLDIVDWNKSCTGSNLPDGTLTAAYPTLASGLYMDVVFTSKTEAAITLFAAKPEDMAAKGIGTPRPPKQSTKG